MKNLSAVCLIAFALTAAAWAGCGSDEHEGQSHTHKNIVGVAQDAGIFNTLLKAAQAAGLADTLSGEGPFTVFAPTDEAFAKLPAGTLEALLADKDQLAQILLYHVVPGDLTAADVVQRKSLKSAQGSPITLTVEGDAVKVNNASVVATDVQASNGIIHVIDAVILPPKKAASK